MATRNTPLTDYNRKKFPTGWVITGCLCGIFVIVIFMAPARWLAAYVLHTTQDRVHLLSPQGTVWNGSAQVKLGAGKGSIDEASLSGRFQWKISPGLQGMVLTFQAECCFIKPWVWIISPNWSGLRITATDIPVSEPSIWPSAVLSGLGTPWNTLQLQGVLAVTTRQLSLQWVGGNWKMVGLAQLDALDMTTSLSTLKPIGSYRFQLQGGETPYLQLSTLKGSLQLQGSGRWVDHTLDFTGEASAQAEHADALASLLNIIGRREGERVIIKI